nr:MAG TPA: hypothetical protein [Caudoviricetes sp.]
MGKRPCPAAFSQRMTELQQMSQLVPVPGIHHNFHRIGSFLRGLRRPALCINTVLHRGIFLDVFSRLCACLLHCFFHIIRRKLCVLFQPFHDHICHLADCTSVSCHVSPPDLPACEFQTLLLIIQMIHTHNVIHLIPKQDPVGNRPDTCSLFTVPHRHSHSHIFHHSPCGFRFPGTSKPLTAYRSKTAVFIRPFIPAVSNPVHHHRALLKNHLLIHQSNVHLFPPAPSFLTTCLSHRHFLKPRLSHSEKKISQIYHQLMMIRLLPVFVQIRRCILHSNLRTLQFFKLIRIRNPCHIHTDLLPLPDQIPDQRIIILKIHTQVILHLIHCHCQLHHLKTEPAGLYFSCRSPYSKNQSAFSFIICTASGSTSFPSTRSFATKPIIPFPANSSFSCLKDLFPRSPML